LYIHKGRYELSLSDGQRWILSASPDLKDWFKQYVKIQGLENWHHLETKKHLKFISPKTSVSGSSKSKIKDLNDCKFFFLDGTQEVLCQVLNQKLKKTSSCFLYPVFREAHQKNGLHTHGALVEFNNQGFIITAKGGTGKTTCCQRLPSSWQVHCDDEILITETKSGAYHGHPLPTWSNPLGEKIPKSKINTSLPIAGIFFLEQADTDSCTPMEVDYAIGLVYKAALQALVIYYKKLSKEEQDNTKDRLLRNSIAFARSVPAYKLQATINGKFWKKIETVIN